ncbi:hypothetical protein SMH99_26110 [Spiroplasma poulsonii]|uniref:hypothetical protein n=1 Tax=Spiroplasma poulsonii TaxID=2138 RepID=UPI000D64D14D|nr:hypothetical protein [Spiroplasma poulsonii]PWF94192.1 hypothetical protein SMH99_26110 [Spiroplasma poulsonii]
MRRASYIDTKIDLNHQQEKVKKLKKLLPKTEMEWQNNWFNNLTGDKQEHTKNKSPKWKELPHQFCEQLKPEKIQVEWKRNWFKNLTKIKKKNIIQKLTKLKLKLKKENNL